MAVPQLQIPQLGAVSGGIDFAPLANLGKVYEEAQRKRNLQEALSGGIDPNNPQSLSALAAKVLPYDSTTGLSLAQLGNTAANRQQDLSWRQQEAQRAQQNADRSFGLQARAADRADEGPVETASQRAQAARANGVDPESPTGKTYILTGRLPTEDTSVQSVVEQRKKAATTLGLAPDSPGYQSYVLTGKMPREDAQPLTATDKKAILEADEGVLSAKTAIGSLDRAVKLSEKALSGPGASKLGYAASFLGESSDIGKRGIATTQLDNEVTSNALSQLKAIFGGAPTEGERKILLDIQGASSQPHEVRKEIFGRARAAAEARLAFNQQRADELRGGSFFKSSGGTSRGAAQPAAAVPAAPSVGEMRDGYRFRGGDPADPASWVKAAGQ